MKMMLCKCPQSHKVSKTPFQPKPKQIKGPKLNTVSEFTMCIAMKLNKQCIFKEKSIDVNIQVEKVEIINHT